MRTLSVYLDTSVIGGCFDKEFETWSLNLFKDFKQGNFIPAVSSLVALEIENAPQKIKDKFSELLEGRHIFLEPTREIEELADIYIEKKIINPKYSDDAMHIALATVNNINMLVSWNFKHIVHFDKIRKFNSVNSEYGYKQIEIYLPREVTHCG